MPTTNMQASSGSTLFTNNAAESAFISFLQSEYLVLSNECRRKYPEIRQALEAVFTELKRISYILSNTEGTPTLTIMPEISTSKLFLKPLIMALETNVAKHLTIVGNIIQRMCLNYECLPIDEIEDVLDILETMAVNGTEDLQLKSLQSIMPLVTGLLDKLHGKRLQHSYWIVFKLLESKHVMIRNTALAVLRQLIIVLFERIGQNTYVPSYRDSVLSAEDPAADPLPMSEQVCDALLIFSDICQSYNDEPTKVFVGLQGLNKLHALELIDSIMGNVLVFQKFPAFLQVLRERVCTMVVKRIDSSDFAENARLWKIATGILHNYYNLESQSHVEEMRIEGEIFVSFAIRILDDPEAFIWRKALATEVLYDLLTDWKLTKGFYELMNERDNPISLVDILECLRRFVQAELHNITSGTVEGVSIPTMEYISVKVPFHSQFDKNSAPMVPKFYLLTVAFNCVKALLEGIQNAFSNNNEELAKGILEKSWNTSLMILAPILATGNIDQTWRELLLSTLQLLLTLLASCQLHEGLRAVLEEEVYQLLKGRLNDYSCLRICQSVLEAGVRIPTAIKSNWVYLFRMVHWFDLYTLNKSKKMSGLPAAPNSQTGSTSNSAAPKQSRLAAFLSPSISNISAAAADNDESTSLGRDMIGQVTENIRQMLELDIDAETFLFMLQAVSTLINELEEQESSTLPIQKLKQLVMHHGELLSASDIGVWSFLGGHILLSLLSSDKINKKMPSALKLTQQGMALEIVSLSTQYIISHSNESEMQVEVLETVLQAVQAGDETVCQGCLESISRIIGSHGECLKLKGWYTILQTIISVLSPNNDENNGDVLYNEDGNLALLKLTFGILGRMAEDYSRNFDTDTLDLYIQALGACAKNRSDLNISLTAVGFLWDVADFILMHQSDNTDNTEPKDYSQWLKVLETLYKLASDVRPEVRNSVVTSLFRAVAELPANQGNHDSWYHLYANIINPLLEGLFKSFSASLELLTFTLPNIENLELTTISVGEEKNVTSPTLSAKAETVKVEWEETLMLALTGSVKVLRTQLSTLQEYHDFFPELVWQRSFLQVVERHCQTGRVNLINAALSELLVISPTTVALQKRTLNTLTKLLNAPKEDLGSLQKWEQGSLAKLLKSFSLPYKDERMYGEWLKAVEVAITIPYSRQDRGSDRDQLNELQKIALLLPDSLYENNSSTKVKLEWGLLIGRILDYSLQINESTENINSNNSNNNKFPTLIAFSYYSLEKFADWIGFPKSAWQGYFHQFLSFIGNWMALKYHCPMGRSGPAWIPAYSAFIKLMKLVNWLELKPEDYELLGQVVIETLKNIHQISEDDREGEEEDERFDIEFITCLQDLVIPQIVKFKKGEEKEKEDPMIQEIFSQLISVSRFLTVSSSSGDFLSEIRPRSKANLAQTALQALIHLSPSIPLALASLTLRMQAIFQSYLQARKLYPGKIDILPRICREEVLHGLETLGKRLNNSEGNNNNNNNNEEEVRKRVWWSLGEELVELMSTANIDERIVGLAKGIVLEMMQPEMALSNRKRDQHPITYFSTWFEE